MLLYGPLRLLLDGLHVEQANGFRWSPDACFSLAAALTGAVAMAMTLAYDAAASGEDNPRWQLGLRLFLPFSKSRSRQKKINYEPYLTN
jgi:hypothetical protein